MLLLSSLIWVCHVCLGRQLLLEILEHLFYHSFGQAYGWGHSVLSTTPCLSLWHHAQHEFNPKTTAHQADSIQNDRALECVN